MYLVKNKNKEDHVVAKNSSQGYDAKKKMKFFVCKIEKVYIIQDNLKFLFLNFNT